MTTTPAKTTVVRTATISVKETTVEAINASQTKVGAPVTAVVTTGSNYNPGPAETADENHAFSLTFNWQESL